MAFLTREKMGPVYHKRESVRSMQENKEKQTMGLVTVTSGYVLWGLLAIYWLSLIHI